MKLSSVSRVVSTHRLSALGLALTLGLVAGCGDDEGAVIGEPSSSGDAAANPPDAAAAEETSEPEPGETSGDVDPVETDGGHAGHPSTDGGAVESGADGGEQSSCGGEGQPCCERDACNGGYVCVVEAPERPDVGRDAGGFPGLVGVLGDAGLLASDAGLLDIDAGAVIAPPPPAGVCEACGGAGERCCAEDTCNDGFSCEAESPRPGAPSACVADEPAAGDGGEPSASSDAAASSNGADAAAECGGLDQPCCEGRGGRGVCDDGLDCDSAPPRGLEGDVCVEG